MIQRIQSVYLLIAAILMAVVVCTPLAVLIGASDSFYLFKSMGVFENDLTLVYPSWGIAVCAVISALISFVSIFLFKKRKLQIKMSYVSIVFIILFYAAFAAYLYTGQIALEAKFSKVEYGLALPAISLIVMVLALTKIKADERLVQSLNRIR
uniref:DUF4293 domain-containing protein n=1 Tax=uncultured Dysgonomonas sp. TaxID=206096 RepID=UPI002608B2F9|nr:DUF4293 domain-containing protein [uncultured Dysgonomonas sp.]